MSSPASFAAAAVAGRGAARRSPRRPAASSRPTARCCSPRWRGREAEASELIERRTEDARPRGEGWRSTLAEWATAVLYNGLGRYDDALAAAQQASDAPDELGSAPGRCVELVEAAARSGERRARRRRPRAALGDDPRQRHRLGARDRGALARAAQRRRGRRAPLPRGDRAARPHPRPRGARPRPSALRRMAAPRAPARRRARAAAHRPRDVHRDGRRGVRRARRARAAGHRRDRPQAHRRDAATS